MCTEGESERGNELPAKDDMELAYGKLHGMHHSRTEVLKWQARREVTVKCLGRKALHENGSRGPDSETVRAAAPAALRLKM